MAPAASDDLAAHQMVRTVFEDIALTRARRRRPEARPPSRAAPGRRARARGRQNARGGVHGLEAHHRAAACEQHVRRYRPRDLTVRAEGRAQVRCSATPAGRRCARAPGRARAGARTAWPSPPRRRPLSDANPCRTAPGGSRATAATASKPGAYASSTPPALAPSSEPSARAAGAVAALRWRSPGQMRVVESSTCPAVPSVMAVPSTPSPAAPAARDADWWHARPRRGEPVEQRRAVSGIRRSHTPRYASRTRESASSSLLDPLATMRPVSST
jgi:hypothetical protein